MNVDIGYVIQIVLHITGAAMMVGATMGAAAGVKRARAGGDAAMLVTVKEANRRGMIAQIGSIITFVTGLGLIFYLGGFKVMPANYHGALGLLLLAIIIGFLVMKPAGTKLQALVEQHGAAPNADVDAVIKKLIIGTSVLKTLWLVILVLMYVKFGYPKVM